MKQINLNSEVSVKLTPNGLKHWESKFNAGIINPHACYGTQRPHPMDFDDADEFRDRLQKWKAWEKKERNKFTFADKLKLYVKNDGFARFPLHELMAIFGEKMVVGSPDVMFETNTILINDKDLEIW